MRSENRAILVLSTRFDRFSFYSSRLLGYRTFLIHGIDQSLVLAEKIAKKLTAILPAAAPAHHTHLSIFHWAPALRAGAK